VTQFPEAVRIGRELRLGVSDQRDEIAFTLDLETQHAEALSAL